VENAVEDTNNETSLADPPPAGLDLSASGLTDRGRERPNNEDQFIIADVRRVLHIQQSSIPQPESLLGGALGHLLVVADGIGGHRSGDVASTLAVVGIENLLLNTIGWLCELHGDRVLRELHQVLRTTDRWVEQAGRRPELKGMGTTLTMAYVSDRTLFLAHAGDSRCYLWRQGALRLLTHDHTLVAELVTAGTLTPEQAASHEMRNVVLNSLGGGNDAVKPEVHRHLLEPDDVILLCTDGLTGMLPDQEISAILARGGSTEEICRLLIDEANRKGGKDNITAVVGHFAGAGPE
jgi:serine/threonine protein phosphatase PrpC